MSFFCNTSRGCILLRGLYTSVWKTWVYFVMLFYVFEFIVRALFWYNKMLENLVIYDRNKSTQRFLLCPGWIMFSQSNPLVFGKQIRIKSCRKINGGPSSHLIFGASTLHKLHQFDAYPQLFVPEWHLFSFLNFFVPLFPHTA